MTLGTVQGVIDLCGNTDTSLIERMLVKARARLDKMLAKEGLTAPATDGDLDSAVEAIAAKKIGVAPGAVNPRTNFAVDGFSRKDGDKSQLDEWQDIVNESVADYVDTANISTSPIPALTVVGRSGVRIGEYEEMSEEAAESY